ncbi:MAG: M1 family metallopeptidase [Bacteroidota bacterium]
MLTRFSTKRLGLVLSLALISVFLYAQKNINDNKFRQLGQELPTPNSYRNAAGAPGHEYWQQQADYKMSIEIDDNQQRLYGEETITYTNNSPDKLEYLWVQLDQNMRAADSDTYKSRPNSIRDKMNMRQISALTPTFDGGFKIDYVQDANGKALNYTVNRTMMRIDLAQPLASKGSYTFKIKWWYNINNTQEMGGRSGYENFPEDDNNVYVIAQYFPRMCVYDDKEGWQNKQFLGRGEFALPFGNYEVEIKVPADHLVAATGELQNSKDVLSKAQRKRLETAKNESVQPVTIATLEEADERMKGKSDKTKTWKFKADNVRDFAFATSRRFIWDALGVKLDNGKTAMAMSMWTKEGDCLWSKYSTKAVAHTLKWYSHYTFDYPYPVAWSIDGSMGMEYPMICFNYGRCNDDDTYTARMKYGHIGVIIHEVGHNFFPMIVNSDERQWTWMDEGLNSFVQYLTQEQWERDYPSRRGPAKSMVSYMSGDKNNMTPIMTNSESIFQFGNNAYGKPAAGLNILRETILGRDLFDHAFKTYSQRWAFKHPAPADLFRTMEDASGTDLDWFWRGWFYTTDNVDIAIEGVQYFKLDSKNPEVENMLAKADRDKAPRRIGSIRNEKEIAKTYDEADTSLRDFYTEYDPLDVSILDKEDYQNYLNKLSEEEKALLTAGLNYYEVEFKNVGGMPMPIIVQFEFLDGTTEVQKIPAEIWRMDQESVTKVFVMEKEVKEITLDPFLETADTDTSNNYYPPRQEKSKFELFKSRRFGRGQTAGENPMQRANRAKAKMKQGSNE